MRQRLSQQERRSDILKHAQKLFIRQGYSVTEMEDIRKACGISRGGLYHHFASKNAILDAIVSEEVSALAGVLEQTDQSPIETLLEVGSAQLGNDPGILAAMKDTQDKLLYLSGQDVAMTRLLSPVLSTKLKKFVRADAKPVHIGELFLTINARINRRVILGDWTQAQSAGFAATALEALAPFLKDATRLRQIIQTFRTPEDLT